MPLLCAIAIVRPEMKVIRGDSSVLLPGSSLHSARASKNYNLILFRTILHPPDSFVSKNEGMAEGWDTFVGRPDTPQVRADMVEAMSSSSDPIVGAAADLIHSLHPKVTKGMPVPTPN